ncbi:MAG: flagellar biosynthesis anti-sigma factor FlgM [Armatimonadota bacterium]|jgi:anti-sigma28 factor (negative regulator of flagellin synthesis)
MRITTSGLHAGAKPAQIASEAAGQAETRPAREVQADNVCVSSRARLLVLARDALEAAPAVRRDVVEAARDRLSSGPEAYDGHAIARAMIDAISEETT